MVIAFIHTIAFVFSNPVGNVCSAAGTLSLCRPLQVALVYDLAKPATAINAFCVVSVPVVLDVMLVALVVFAP